MLEGWREKNRSSARRGFAISRPTSVKSRQSEGLLENLPPSQSSLLKWRIEALNPRLLRASNEHESLSFSLCGSRGVFAAWFSPSGRFSLGALRARRFPSGRSRYQLKCDFWLVAVPGLTLKQQLTQHFKIKKHQEPICRR